MTETLKQHHWGDEDEIRNRVGFVILQVFGAQDTRRKNRSKLARQCEELQNRFTLLIIDLVKANQKGWQK